MKKRSKESIKALFKGIVITVLMICVGIAIFVVPSQGVLEAVNLFLLKDRDIWGIQLGIGFSVITIVLCFSTMYYLLGRRIKVNKSKNKVGKETILVRVITIGLLFLLMFLASIVLNCPNRQLLLLLLACYLFLVEILTISFCVLLISTGYVEKTKRIIVEGEKNESSK